MSNKSSIKNFGGKFKQVFSVGDATFAKEIYMTKVIYNDPATIVFWSDGTKTVSKCSKLDTYNKEMGLLLCYMKKIVGSNEVRNVLNNWNVGLNVMDISDVRWFIRNGYDHIDVPEDKNTMTYGTTI